MRTFSKLAIVVAVGAATAAAVRRYDLVNKGAALAEKGVEKVAVGAEWLTGKAVDFGTKFLDQFAEADLASDPTEDKDIEPSFDAAMQAADEDWKRRTSGASVGFGDVR